MLDSLHIENVAVIKTLDVDFSSGFTVFTGETGAGKSIIIDSIRLILGAKADKGLIRSGEESAYVSAVFSSIDSKTLAILKDNDLSPDDDGNLIISRSLGIDGKSKAKIGSLSVPSSLLREIGESLIAIHGQHDSMKLLDSSAHLSFLDSYAGCEEIINEYKAIYHEMNDIGNKLKAEALFYKEKHSSVPVLAASLKEIEEADIKDGEEEKLDERRKILKNSAKLSKNIGVFSKSIKGSDNVPGAITLIKLAENALSKISSEVDGSAEILERMRTISAELEGITDDVENYCDTGDFESPEEALAAIEERLSVIDRLTRKYGNLNEYKKNAIETLKRIDDSASLLESYKKKLSDLSSKAYSLAEKISEIRKKAGGEFEKKVLLELAFLDLSKVRFEVSITRDMLPGGNIRLTPEGCDKVVFMISPNVGEDMKELAKIASGGEMSRIMLALCCVFADKYGIPSMIFDEIDTGISGKTSEKIGIKLRETARGDVQVFCVTHSAQVASSATRHIKIEKKEQDGRTVTTLTNLDGEERVKELARIMGGIEITESILSSAREMISKNSGK